MPSSSTPPTVRAEPGDRGGDQPGHRRSRRRPGRHRRGRVCCHQRSGRVRPARREWLVDAIGGAGNVLYIRGIDGVPADTDRHDGFTAAMAGFPGIVSKEIFTGWDFTVGGRAVHELTAADYTASGPQASTTRWSSVRPRQGSGADRRRRQQRLRRPVDRRHAWCAGHRPGRDRRRRHGDRPAGAQRRRARADHAADATRCGTSRTTRPTSKPTTSPTGKTRSARRSPSRATRPTSRSSCWPARGQANELIEGGRTPSLG